MASIPDPNPELMVIGDSLAQGCRTLSVCEEHCAQSYAAIIARSQGWAFRPPAFPRPVLFDLEQEIRNLSLVGVVGGLKRLRRNLDDWQRDFTQGPGADLPPAFDNLAVAGLSIAQMTDFSAGGQRERLRDDLFPRMIGKPLGDLFDAVGDAHLAINSAFVLNPTGAADWDGLTQLDWVARRRPRRLIAHFGHNDGLYPVGSEADTTQFHGDYDATLAAYRDVLDRLSALPAEVGLIAVVLYPKLGAVANLEPHGPRDRHGYARAYRTRFPLPGDEITGRELRRVDERIKAFNRAVRLHIDGLPDAGRFRLVDAYRIFAGYDYKNTNDAARQVVIGRKRIDNRYLTGSRRFVGRPGQANRRVKFAFEYGGLLSLDGMHPSAVGYAMLACEIMRKLDLIFDQKAILAQALRDEDLISRYNRNLHHLGFLLDTVEDLRPTDRDEEAISLPAVLGVQQRAFTRRG